MKPKPTLGSEYNPQLLNLVRSLCLFISTKIGDFSNDFVVAGGLVPILIIQQDPPPMGADKHVGTRDLDLGFSLGILDSKRYQEFAARLRSAGFTPDFSKEGNQILQRWRLKEDIGATVDFLIPQSSPAEVGGTIKHLESDFGAIITPGLELAFRDRIRVTMSGETPLGETAQRDVWVCGPGAFIALKALAFASRGENKDAYDLYYVVRNFGIGPEQVAKYLAPLLDNSFARDAVRILRSDFANPESIGPSRVSRFLFGEPDAETQADVAGYINQLLTFI
ncbi:MAG: nucleotidyl transferase AbiEii/AbiGii toxin family protein [Anaerolineales bacterium]|nr:nucleotidyl transferase AbiEii/AbiGii toxin family protein [Anaerolineales bacterium]